MRSRRSFFAKFMALAAVVVLAPEIAFRAKLALPTELGPFLTQSERQFICLSEGYKAWMEEFSKWRKEKLQAHG